MIFSSQLMDICAVREHSRETLYQRAIHDRVQLPSDTLPWASIIITFFNAAKPWKAAGTEGMDSNLIAAAG